MIPHKLTPLLAATVVRRSVVCKFLPNHFIIQALACQILASVGAMQVMLEVRGPTGYSEGTWIYAVGNPNGTPWFAIM